MTNTIKNILTVLVFIVIIFVAFKLFVQEKEADVEKTSEALISNSSLTVELTAPTKEAAITLIKLKSIKIDRGLFSSSIFNSLKDFRVIVLPEDIGRNNPFAPVGRN